MAGTEGERKTWLGERRAAVVLGDQWYVIFRRPPPSSVTPISQE